MNTHPDQISSGKFGAAGHDGGSTAIQGGLLAQPRRLLVAAYAVGITAVVAMAMLIPTGVVSIFPPEPPKSAAQLVDDKLAEQGITFDSESFVRGQSLFAVNCVACHTPDGGAKPNLGKDMVHSEFTADSSDKQLLTFLKLGRNPGDPLNTTGVGMPPKGGNPALSEKDLKDLISYLRGLQIAEDVKFNQ